MDYLKIAQTQKNYTFNTSASMDARSLGDRKLPESLYTVNYSGVLSERVYVEARYSGRRFAFEDNGAKSTDLIQGTLLLDQSRAGGTGRTRSAASAARAAEQRRLLRQGHLLPVEEGQRFALDVVQCDNFNDIRNANNHQSGSDYRILGTSSYLLPTGDVVPQFLGNNTTIIQYNPLPSLSQGANFRTHSAFFTDAWRINGNLTANLGLRWDKNHGVDQSGNLTADDSGWSPRVALVWDPTGKVSGR